MEAGKLTPISARFNIIALLPICLLLFACQKQGTGGMVKVNQPDTFSFQKKPGSRIVFLSTQLNPVEEAGKMRNQILKDFPGEVDFRPNDNVYLFRQINSLLQNNPSESILVGALHGDLATLYEEGSLRPMTDIYSGLAGRTFSENLLKLSKLDGKDIYYIPWMQASFVVAVNKKALKYLPADANLEELTYFQLYHWAREIMLKTGKKALGFPAGTKGLMHRFFQGYLYPSYTGSTLLKFRSPEAVQMWQFFKEMWQVVNPASLVYSTMADPLLADDVWIAWDHSARLAKVFEEKPDDFVAIPAPIGPRGRGFMPVLSGLGIPKNVRITADPALLIDYLTQPAIQNRTLRETGFFPLVISAENTSIALPLGELSRAVEKQAAARNAIPTLLPIGLGERGTEYNNLFMLTFSDIVLGGGRIADVLNSNARELQKIINATNARSWLPDSSKERPSQIE
jgi:multiple sugar transport system substrate-binding protein